MASLFAQIDDMVAAKAEAKIKDDELKQALADKADRDLAANLAADAKMLAEREAKLAEMANADFEADLNSQAEQFKAMTNRLVTGHTNDDEGLGAAVPVVEWGEDGDVPRMMLDGKEVVTPPTPKFPTVSELPPAEPCVNDINTPQELVIATADPIGKAPPPPSRKDIVLNVKQQLAITTALQSAYSNIIGYAGSGKTTTVMELVRQLIEGDTIRKLEDVRDLGDRLNHLMMNRGMYNFAMCAFTGLAVKALRKSVPNEYKNNCYTIHKLIDFGPVEKLVLPSPEEVKQRGLDPNVPIAKRFFEPRKHGGKCERWDAKKQKAVPCSRHEQGAKPTEDAELLPFDFIIIDEVSMLGTKLYEMLLDALPDHCRIVTIGDIAQLPPVMDVPIQPLLLAQWPTTELTEIYRQKDGDMISNANAIRQCEKPTPSENFRLKGIDTDEAIAQKQVLAFIKSEYDAGKYDPEQDILITPMNVGMLGQEMMNVLTRTFANPDNPTVNIKTMRGQKRLAKDDRVLCIKNDNDLGVYNGMLGWVNEVSINAGMGKYVAGSMDAGSDLDSDEFDVTSAVEGMLAQQKEVAQMKKVNAMFGGNLVSPDLLAGDDQEEEGTGKRAASHCAHVQFDYEPEDDPSGRSSFHSMGTSTQLENLIPAWWITIHKSQGSGFRNVYILLHNTSAKMLSNELLYTAVTRCIENVTILTTNYAFNKCLKQQKIKGATLDAKIQSYIDGYLNKVKQAELRRVYIPTAESYGELK